MPSAIAQSPPRPLPASAIPTNPPDLSQKLPRLTPRRRDPTKLPNRKPRGVEAAPPTPRLLSPPSLTSVKCIHPVKRILSPEDHRRFLASPTYRLVISFAFSIADSVKDTPISAVTIEELHPTVKSVLSILDRISEAAKQCPPDDNGGSRFGNPAFRRFLSEVEMQAPTWQKQEFGDSLTDNNRTASMIDELCTYLTSSFGSSSRIDYGSGHELNLLSYLLCLYQLSLIPQFTFPSLALVVFPRYLSLMRTLQGTYYLEPAGSHGVWGLDDYHFLPFLFGASQLQNHPFIRPLAIHSEATLDAYGDDYLYLDMVRQVNATKTVQGLRWHSPMLDDISGVREGWVKVLSGLKKMFEGEVLGKLPVMQHFLFGGLIPAAEGMSGTEGSHEVEELVEPGHEGHAHNHDSWSDACGIKVPSSVGAVQELRKRMGGEVLRRLPFD